jgi:hypothetical protein
MKNAILGVITLLTAVLHGTCSMAQNNERHDRQAYSAQQLADLIRNRPANEGRVGNMHFILRNAKGNERKRSALLIHSERDEDIKIAIFFTSPAALQDTVFLSHDYALQEDENWLFLPATKRVRRIPSANRGDYFMGTDLTYGDIKDDFKFSADDWDFSLGDTPVEQADNYAVLLGLAKNDAKKSELGYASFYALVDLNSYIPVELRYTDTLGKPLKEMFVHQQAQVGGAWTAMQFTIKQLQLSHQTDIILEDMRYIPNLPEALLSAESLSYGLPQL